VHAGFGDIVKIHRNVPEIKSNQTSKENNNNIIWPVGKENAPQGDTKHKKSKFNLQYSVNGRRMIKIFFFFKYCNET